MKFVTSAESNNDIYPLFANNSEVPSASAWKKPPIPVPIHGECFHEVNDDSQINNRPSAEPFFKKYIPITTMMMARHK